MFRPWRKAENTPAMSGENQTNVSRPPAKHSIHFKVPAMMIGTLLVGTFLALGQHLFYKSLDGHPIPSQGKQAWNGRYGIALTLLVKAFLSTAIGIACVQNIWWLLRSRSTRLETIDSTFGILGSGLKLADFRVWVFAPNVAMLALGVWVIVPLTAVSPPTTLTIRSTIFNSSQSMKVPNIDYAVDNFALGGGHATGSYEGPSPDILRLVNNVATQGSILNFAENAPCKDCAYSLSFYGPLVRCNQLAGNWSNLITTTVSNWTTTANYEEDVPLYSAFVPSIVEDSNFTAAFIGGLNALYKNDFLPIDANSTDYSKLFINYYSSNSHGLECGLYNASYEVDFNFNNGTQSVNLANLTYLNGVAYADYSTYQLLEGFNLTDYPQLPNNETVQAGLRYDMSVAAYQAVMQSLNSILVGHMEQSSADSGVLISNIRILSSCLSTSPELGDIVGAMTQFSADPNAPSISSSNVPLAQAIQELSQNITMSLFSSPDYLAGAKSMANSKAPEVLANASSTNVLSFRQVNVYVYSPRYLLASWGVAIFYTIFAVLLGFLALAKNGVAYSNNFSTVLRAARHVELDAGTHPHEKTGADPLPKYLAKQSITLRMHVPVENDSLESVDVPLSSEREENGLQDGFGEKP